MQLPAISPMYIAFLVLAAVVNIVMPIALAIILVWRLKAKAWMGFAGALVFVVFQFILRIPWVTALQAHYAAQLKADTAFALGFLALLAVTAGLFEEVGRYVGYRVFFRKTPATWGRVLVFGAGHGGVEAIVLAGLAGLASAASIALLPSTFATLPPSVQHTAVEQFQAIAAQPVWLPLVGIYERVGAITFHLGMSVVVYQTIRRHQIGWLFLAIALHAMLDFGAVAATMIPGLGTVAKVAAAEGVVTVGAAVALALIFRLREPARDGAPDASSQAAPAAS